MNIVQMPQIYFPSLGGIQVLTHMISKNLVSRGCEVEVLTPKCENYRQYRVLDTHSSLPSKEKIDDVEIFRAPISYQKLKYINRFNLKTRRLRKFRLKKLNEYIDYSLMGPYMPESLKTLKTIKPNVIIAYSCYYMNAYWGYKYSEKYNIPFILVPSINFNITMPEYARKLVKRANRCVAFTSAEKDYLVDEGVEIKNIVVIPNGVEIDQFDNKNGNQVRKRYSIGESIPIVLYLGRKDGKGVEYLLRSMKHVWQRNSDCVLILAGDARNEDTKEMLKRELKELEPRSKTNIINIDHVKHEDRVHLMDACDVFVSVSNVDSFGLVYLDAWSCKKPIIAMKDSLPSSYMNEGSDCLLVDYGDPITLGNRISRLIKDKEYSRTLGQNGYKRVLAEFESSQIGSEYFNLAESLINVQNN